jgi:uncharacterized protein with beta-barrel porin domain
MRINKIHLAGLAVALAGGVSATNADATDRTISTATTTPVTTSQPEPPSNTTPGDVTIASGGSITVTAGQTAVTIDSSNDVSNAGQLASTNADNTTAILLTGGFTGSATNTGTINLLEDYVLADSDSDGNLDGAWAQGTNRHGILLNAGSAFTGDIINSGSITVEGNNSSGITLADLLIGDLNSTGAISVTGDNSYGVAITGGSTAGVNGDVRVAGGMSIRGENSSGLVVSAPITGSLRVNGSWTVTGFHTVNGGSSITGLDADDLLLSGAAISVSGNVAGGIVIEGVGVEDDLDDDGDGLPDDGTDTTETNDDLTAAIASYGSAPTLQIQSDGVSNLTVGTAPSGFGLHIRGSLISVGVYSGFDSTAVRIEGNGASTTTINGGIAVDRVITATAFDGDSYGLVVGNGATTSQILVRGTLSSIVASDLAQTAYGILLESGANVASLSNSGTMRTQVFGEIGDSVVIQDNSNTLASITNSGSIQAQNIPTDADTTDNVLPPAITGDSVAIDVSASSINVTLNQVADTVFNDDDADDDDSAARPDVLIHGDVRFGSGNDIFNLLAGEVIGDVSFGNGADAFTIDNGATYEGILTDSDGLLTLNVVDGSLTSSGGTLNLTSANFAADSSLTVTLFSTTSLSTYIHSSGAITFAAGAEIIPVVPAGLPVSGSQTFLTADGGLFGASNVTGAVSSSSAPYLYNININTVSGDPNSLEASYIMRTPAQLGLNTNQTSAFSSIIEALRLNDNASNAFAALPDQSSFLDAYADLMPSYASAATELAATAIQQSQSATSNRLAHTRLHGLDEVSAWAQEIGYFVSRTPLDVNGQEFDGAGFGLAVGIDGPLDNGALFGLSASFLASEATEPNREDGEISTWLGQANAYLGTAMGPVDLDFIVGAGAGKMRSRRFVEIGTAFSTNNEAEWWTYEGHGAARASVPLALSDWFVITPQAALTYVAMSEQGYEETGAGAAFDMEADSVTSQRLWADAGVELSARWRLRNGGFVAPRLYAGYRANAIDEGAERTFRFVSGSSDFTLADEPLGSGGALVGLGLDATNGYSTFSLSYEGEFGDQIDRHSLNAAVRFRF